MSAPTNPPTPRAGCASCGKPLSKNYYAPDDWYCAMDGCAMQYKQQPVPPASAPAATAGTEPETPTRIEPCHHCENGNAIEVCETTTAQWGTECPPVEIEDTLWRCQSCGAAWYDAKQSQRHTRALLRATIDAQATALAALRARVEELETPDIMGDADGVGYFEDDYDCLVDDAPVGTIREVWANRTLGQRWIVRVPTNDEDFETRVFDSLADAQRAVAKARAALAPHQTTEGQP